MSRATLAAHGFEGKPGQVLVLPAVTGATPIAIGVGDPGSLTANGLPCHIQPAEYTIPALVAALKKHFAKA